MTICELNRIGGTEILKDEGLSIYLRAHILNQAPKCTATPHDE